MSLLLPGKLPGLAGMAPVSARLTSNARTP